MFNSCSVPFRDSYYKGKPDHAAATHHAFVYYMLMVMQQVPQNNFTMTNNLSILLQAISGMGYYGKGKEVDLMESEENCTHKVCDLVLISVLSHLDTRMQGNAD